MRRWHVIADLLLGHEPLTGAEIGVKKGEFTSYLCGVYSNLRMYAVDPFVTQPGANETYEEWSFNNIKDLFNVNVAPYRDRVTHIENFSKDAVLVVPDESLDFVFIDAQHDYDSVKQDIGLWLPKVKQGGLISGHDYNPRKFKGVIDAVDEMLGKVEVGADVVWYQWKI